MSKDIIQSVFDMSEVFLASEPIHVELNNEAIEKLGRKMKKDGVVNFYNSESEQEYRTNVFIEILKELVACSINYCYWHGSHDIKSVSSSTMYDDVNTVFETDGTLMFERRIQTLIRNLSLNRYPLLEERKRHLLELCEGRKAENFVAAVNSRDLSGERLFYEMIEIFQGFSVDIFLKRTSLFFIQLYRKFGWYEDLMRKLFVPADYQLPKILEHFWCIEYSKSLIEKIDNSVLIESNSLEELQIRAATIKSCKMLQDITGWNIADIDTWLWTKKKNINKPFHLTYTTNY